MSQNKRFYLILSIMAVTFTMRAPIFSVGPLVSLIGRDYALSLKDFGFLTTLPLIAFAVFSPLTAVLSSKAGMNRTMLIGLLITLAGVLARSYLGVFGLYFGTALMGIGISFANVLIPGIIKSGFPGSVGLVTGLYCTFMSVFAGLGPGLSVPLADTFGLGWKGSLAFWSLPCAAAILFWLPLSEKKRIKTDSSEKDENKVSMLKSPLAWAATVFIGLQSLVCFSAVAWLPSVFAQNGHSARSAGYMIFYMQLLSILGSFIVPVLADRMKDQVKLNAVFGLIFFLGAFGLILSGHSAALTMVSLTLFGIGLGSSFSLFLTFISKRTRNSKDTARLSGMSQSLGYLLAALGPPLLGAAADATGSWSPALLTFAACTLALLALGHFLGRDVTLSDAINKEKLYVDSD
ncbi:MAG: MFS transporter [Bacillota bacterium]|nr:MFS transporter [Bacillota bacterium]